MKSRRIWFVIIILAISFLPVLWGCGGGGGGGGGGDGQQTTTSTLNGTFNGDITTTQDGRDSVYTVNLSLTVGSPLSGTFFRQSDGAVGTISGDAVEDSATFIGTSSGDCPASFDGTITLMDNNTISVSMVGSDCNGSFNADGMLTKVECIDIDGTYDAEETVTATCTAQGESETVIMSGMGIVVIEQNRCNVSYVVPEFDVLRNGKIEGNNISFTGPFVIPLAGGVNLTQNTASIEGTIVDENRITLNGSGIATGTFDGISFSCTGESTGVFTRRIVEFEVKHRSYIPSNYVPGTSCRVVEGLARDDIIRPTVFNGNDRREPEPFGSFKTETLVLASVPHRGDGILLGSTEVGETLEYASDALEPGCTAVPGEVPPCIDEADDDGVLDDCSRLHRVGEASTSSMFFDVQRISDDSTRIIITGGARIPLVPSPAIDWDLEITVDSSGRYTVSGAHDCFPAHEIFINNQPIWSFIPSGTPPFDLGQIGTCLSPPMNVNVSAEGFVLEDRMILHKSTKTVRNFNKYKIFKDLLYIVP